MPTTSRPLKAFLCHAHADKSAVRNLYRHLKERKIDAWLDAEKLLPGQNWQVEIPKALLSSDVIIICLSKNSVDKEGYVQKEIKFALDKALEMPEGRIFLIPARLEECNLPYSLRDYHFVNLFEADGYKRLLRSLRARAEQIGATKVGQITNLPPHEEPKDNSIDVGEDITHVTRQAVAVSRTASPAYQDKNANHEVVPEQPVGQVSNLTDAKKKGKSRTASPTYEYKPIEKKKSIVKLEPKKQTGTKFPLWGIGLTALAILGLAVWGLSPIIASTKTPLLMPTLDIVPTMISEKDGATLIYVQAGEFTMGSNGLFSNSDEKPVHVIYLDAFWIDKTEVTNKQYRACVDAGVCEPPSSIDSSTHYYGNPEFDNYPVANMNWDKANRYCEVWAGGDLPTEAQWEKAARGTDGRTYPWGENIDCIIANYNSSCVGDATPVGSYKNGKSPYGVYDMAGNVWEWMNDWYSGTYYQNSLLSNPLGPDTGTSHVVRGGSWSNTDYDARSASRLAWTEEDGISSLFGFRCSHSE